MALDVAQLARSHAGDSIVHVVVGHVVAPKGECDTTPQYEARVVVARPTSRYSRWITADIGRAYDADRQILQITLPAMIRYSAKLPEGHPGLHGALGNKRPASRPPP